MRHNRQRHKTLGFLSDNFIEFESLNKKPNFKLGKSFEDIISELECDPKIIEKIFSRLYLDGEVKYTNAHWENGLYLTQKGLSSYASKKYIKENENIILNWFKVFVQIIVPVLSLIIAFLALTLKFNSISENIEKKVNNSHQLELKHLKLKLDSLLQLENNRKTKSIFENNKTD